MTNDIFGTEGARAGAAFNSFVSAFLDAQPARPEHIEIYQAAANAFDAYYRHVLDLEVDKYGILQEKDAVDYNACSSCWCADCAKLYTCPAYDPADGITPPSCAECARIISNKSEGYEGPLHPTSDRPDCGEYRPAHE
jgi:hypothetical protein